MPAKKSRLDAGATEKTAVSILDLSEEVTLKIFEDVDSLEDRLDCERVCKQWKGLLRQPSPLWATVMFHVSNEDTLTIQHQCTMFLAFLRRRLPALRQLGVYGDDDVELDGALITLLAGATALRDLEVMTSVPPQALLLCSLLGQVQRFNMNFIQAPIDADAFNATISGLSSLRVLDWGVSDLKEDAAGEVQPCGFPSALLAASGLETLRLVVHRTKGVFDFGPLPARLLSNLSSSLRRLCLDTCNVTALPPTVSALTRLESLSVLCTSRDGGAPLLDIPSQISCCTALESIAISTSGSPPGGIFELGASLTHLTLDQCRPLPSHLQHISRLQRLEELRLCRSRDADMQNALGSLRASTTLTSLSLEGSELRVLPALTCLSSLLALNLRSNRLSAVPPQVEYLTKLTMLDLSWNPTIRLRNISADRDDSRLFGAGHSLKVLGMRREPETIWSHIDTQAAVKIASRLGRHASVATCNPCDCRDQLDGFSTMYLLTYIC